MSDETRRLVITIDLPIAYRSEYDAIEMAEHILTGGGEHAMAGVLVTANFKRPKAYSSDPMDYMGPNVHTGDPDTSYEAQISVNVSGKSQRAKVLHCMYDHRLGLTVDEVETFTRLEEYQARRRVTELFHMDYLWRTRDKRPGRKGAMQSVMRITPSGVLMAEQLGAGR